MSDRRTACVLLTLLACLLATAAAWQEDLVARSPNTTVDEGSVLKFSGNISHKDHFKLLERDGNSLLIGARNIVFNISLTDLTERREERLEWHSEPEDVDLCIMKGLDEEACHNYIRVLAKRGDDELFVCGTNSYKPRCRSYTKNPELGYVPDGSEQDGRGLCPYSPKHNSTVTFVDGELYAGTVADFAGSDPLVYRRPLRTEQFELKQLNAPSFVGSMEYEDHVYFFFRETAVEYMNCGKRMYSRVARVCKKDQGGSYKHRNSWTSFLKSRLNCSIPGEYPFYFDEIQSISTVQSGVYGGRQEQILYAVFTTPVNSIAGSAICAFRMADLVDSFNSEFKHQEDMNSNWLPLKNSQAPSSPRPGVCVNDSQSLSDAHISFIQSHPLMDGAVPALHGRPLLARTSLRHRFTKIAVDPQVRAADGTLYDVLFIGTDNGRVLKAVNAASGAASVVAEPVLIEELEVLASGAPITNLLVSRQPGTPPRLIVVTDDEVRALPLHRCGDKAVRCADCVRLQDPYCGWEAAGQRCAPVNSPAWPEDVAVVQNVSHGVHPHCAEDDARYEEELFFSTIPTPPSTAASAVGGAVVPCACGDSGLTASSGSEAGRTPAVPRTRTDTDTDTDIGDDDDDDVNTDDLLEPKNDRELYNAVDGTGKVYDIIEHSKSYSLGQATESQQQGSPDAVYTAKTMAIAVVATCLLAMLIGFLAGWLFSRRWPRNRNEPYYETAHPDQSKLKQVDTVVLPVKPDNRVDLVSQTLSNPEPSSFMGNNGKQINIVVNQTKNTLDRKTDAEPAGYDTLQKKRTMYL